MLKPAGKPAASAVARPTPAAKPLAPSPLTQTRRTAPAPVEALPPPSDRPIAVVAGAAPSQHPKTLVGYLAPTEGDEPDAESVGQPFAVDAEAAPVDPSTPIAAATPRESFAVPLEPKPPRSDQTESLTNDDLDQLAVSPAPTPPIPAARPQRGDQTEALTNDDFDRMSVTPPPAPSGGRPPRGDQTEALTNADFDRMSVTPPPAPRAPVAGSRAPATKPRDEPHGTIADEVAQDGGGAARWIVVPLALVIVAAALYWAFTQGGSSTPASTESPVVPATPAMPDRPATAANPSDAPAVHPAPSIAATAAIADAGAAAASPDDASVAIAPSSAPAASGLAAAFDAAALDRLAPLPPVPTRTARLRASARSTRAGRAIHDAARPMRAHAWDDAAHDFTTALVNEPTNVAAMRGLAQIAIAQEHWDVALAWCQRALVVEADDVEVLLLRGDALSGSGDRTAAREAWSKVLELDPRNRDARARMRRRR